MKDTINNIKDILNDRVSSPLAASFIISWLLVNYKFIIILLSMQSVENKFGLISTMFPIDLFIPIASTICKLIILPLIFTAFYIYLYPIPARRVYEHVRKEQLKLEKLRNDIEKSTVLTSEQADELRRRHYLQVEELKLNIKNREEENNSFITISGQLRDEKQRSSDLTIKVKELSEQLNTSLEKKESTRELVKHESFHELKRVMKPLLDNQKDQNARLDNLLSKYKISSSELKLLTTIYEDFNETSFNKESVFFRKLKTSLSLIKTEKIVNKLIREGFIKFSPSLEGMRVTVLEKGKKVLLSLA